MVKDLASYIMNLAFGESVELDFWIHSVHFSFAYFSSYSTDCTFCSFSIESSASSFSSLSISPSSSSSSTTNFNYFWVGLSSTSLLGLVPGMGWVPCTLPIPFFLRYSAFLLRNSMLFIGFAIILF